MIKISIQEKKTVLLAQKNKEYKWPIFCLHNPILVTFVGSTDLLRNRRYNKSWVHLHFNRILHSLINLSCTITGISEASFAALDFFFESYIEF